MKCALSFFLLITLSTAGQNPLGFNKRFVESEDKWVAFEMDKDSAYSYGFIYIDPQAGLTFNSEGSFTISSSGAFIPKKLDANLKIRLQPNQVKVAFIPADKFAELKITAVPDWLHYYKTDTASVEHLYQWGYLYNGWDQCEKALTYLLRAQQLDPKYKGLEVELAFSYNSLKQYDKAVTILKEALETSPGDCYLYKELAYALGNLSRIDDAADTYKKAMASCNNSAMKAEIAYNIARQYYKLKDKKHFEVWAKETRKWAKKDDPFVYNLKRMKTELD